MTKHRNWRTFATCLPLVFLLSFKPAAAAQYILYTANINATLQNCGCGKMPLGGLDRIKTFVDSFRTENPNTILIDGGDFFNSYSYPELNQSVLESLVLMEYDLFVPGEHAFVEGSPFFIDISRCLAGRIILSNVNWRYNRGFLESYHRTDLNLIAVLNSKCFDYIALPEQFELSALPDSTIGNNRDGSYTILVYHGTIDTISDQILNFARPDIILLAHDQYLGETDIAGIRTIGIGKDGEHIAVIKLTTGFTCEVTFEKITEEIKPDPRIILIDQKFSKQMNR